MLILSQVCSGYNKPKGDQITASVSPSVSSLDKEERTIERVINDITNNNIYILH